jgi:hypothetical protein
MTAPDPTAGTAEKPVPCDERPRACRNEKVFSVEAGTWAGAHLVGYTSCARHLADTVAYAATHAQPVRVLDRRTATTDDRAALRAALGEFPTRIKETA